MAHLTSSVEYALHCLLWLVDSDAPLSSHDLAELQGLSPTFLAKIFAKLQKSGIVVANDGLRGGYRLARAASGISVLEVVDAVEGSKPLFDCQQIRNRCVLFEGVAPHWASKGVCAIHALMLEAEKAMRATLADRSLADLHVTFERKSPTDFNLQVKQWTKKRLESRGNRSSCAVAKPKR